MKIAIQGHSTRGKEVIQILESLGGINRMNHRGRYTDYFYYISSDDNTIAWTCIRPQYMNVFTLEEFEKEFPFKVGDNVVFQIINDSFSGTITALKDFEYEVNTEYGYRYVEPYKLQLHSMKEERNITLTLDKAKEWYKKGGELKEIALQAFTEKELNSPPRSWEEFCEKYSIKKEEAFVNTLSNIVCEDREDKRRADTDKNICPSIKSAEAHLAMIQLEQLRDCYRGLFVTVIGMPVWCITRYRGELIVSKRIWGTNETFLSFQSPKAAEEYLKNFKPLIEKAGDLI